MPKKLILDCSSLNSTYRSFEKILNKPQNDIDSVFNDFDLNQYSTNNPNDMRKPGELLLELFSCQGCEINEPNEIYWFHATRVSQSEKFVDGIRPLHDQIEHIWKFLFTLVSDKFTESDWRQFRIYLETQHNSHHAMLYRNRVAQDHDSGPFGLLIREVAIKPEEFESVDYLESPEIIEDICITFSEIYGEDLLALFQQNSRSCIVTFTDPEPRPDTLHKAIYYLYAKYRNEDLVLCNTCFDGEGMAIPPDQIVSVEHL